jgi:hypothetical protein
LPSSKALLRQGFCFLNEQAVNDKHIAPAYGGGKIHAQSLTLWKKMWIARGKILANSTF